MFTSRDWLAALLSVPFSLFFGKRSIAAKTADESEWVDVHYDEMFATLFGGYRVLTTTLRDIYPRAVRLNDQLIPHYSATTDGAVPRWTLGNALPDGRLHLLVGLPGDWFAENNRLQVSKRSHSLVPG